MNDIDALERARSENNQNWMDLMRLAQKYAPESEYGSINTNSIEGFWAIVKRAIYGQFHHVSKKYLGLWRR